MNNTDEKIKKYSICLSLIAKKEILCDPQLKYIVKQFIRTATESNDYHNTVHYRSKQAIKLSLHCKNRTEYQRFCSRNLSHEHVVPCQVQYEMLLSLENKTIESIESFFQIYGMRATISREENKCLTEEGYNSVMPPEFFKKIEGFESFYKNPFARYLKTGLFKSLVAGSPKFV